MKSEARAFAAGANDYLVKWPDPRELVARVRYHSEAYCARRERDAAFASLRLSQEQLAHEAKLDRSYVGQVERGERNITLDNIHRLANALSVSAAALFRESH